MAIRSPLSAGAKWQRVAPFSNRRLPISIARARQQEHYMPPSVSPGRDLRLDLFRGLALWLILLDHIAQNIVNWITIRNYGFSDAAEIFVFISGYTAAFVYGRSEEHTSELQSP